MENISSASELQDAIQLLEAKQTVSLMTMKSNFRKAYENLKPINLIGNILDEITTSPFLTNNIIDSAIGLTAGYISRKAVVKESDGMLRKLFGIVLQFGVTNLVAQNPESVKSFGKFIFQRIFPKKGIESE
ncbi:MAG: hypothetical protein IPF54_14080 [Draconibacterium sp.]|nr:hypothetical protein [Draconibacterium sp.]